MLKTGNRLLQNLALLLAVTSSIVEAADTNRVLQRIKQIATEESGSCERLLARAAPIVDEAYKGSQVERG